MSTITFALLMFMGISACRGELLRRWVGEQNGERYGPVSFTQAREFRNGRHWKHSETSKRFIERITTNTHYGRHETQQIEQGFRESAVWYVCYLAYVENIPKGYMDADKTAEFAVTEVELVTSPKFIFDRSTPLEVAMSVSHRDATWENPVDFDFAIPLRFNGEMFGAIFFRGDVDMWYRRKPTGCTYRLTNRRGSHTVTLSFANKFPSIVPTDVDALPTERQIPRPPKPGYDEALYRAYDEEEHLD